MVTFWFQVCEGACFAYGRRNFEGGPLPMDIRQVPSLSTEQLLAWALAILCELAKRCGVPFAVSADIGTPAAPSVDDEAPMDPAHTAASSSREESAIPTPTTPTGPRQGCCFLCTVRNCQNFCCKNSPHQQHVCDYHSWY